MDVKTYKHLGYFRQEKSEYIAFENGSLMVYIPMSTVNEHPNTFWGPIAPNYYSLGVVFMVYSETDQAIDLSQLIEFKTEEGEILEKYKLPDKNDWKNEITVPAKKWTGIYGSLLLYKIDNLVTDFNPEKEKIMLVPLGYINGKFNIVVSRAESGT